MKKALKFSLIVFVYSILFMVANAILPFSNAFKELNANANPIGGLFLLISCLFYCFVIFYLTKHSAWKGLKRSLGIIFSMFMVAAFMTQIETLFFGDAFSVLTRLDVFFIMLAPLPSIVATTFLTAKFFASEKTSTKGTKKFTLQKSCIISLVQKTALLGLIYMAIYFLFGYFVAWQFEALRVFYSGNPVKLGFIAKLVSNFYESPIIYPFQFIRGMLFVLFILPVFFMLKENKAILTKGIVLVYLTTSIVLIIPNVLFPDVVRWAHFVEMMTSMTLFGIISGLVLYKPAKENILG